MASASLINLGLYHALPCLYFSPLTLNVLLFPEHTKNPTIREPSDLLYSLHKILFNRAFTGLLHPFIEVCSNVISSLISSLTILTEKASTYTI